MAKPLLRAAADASWNDALTLEEFAEPTCFTTAAFADSVETMLSGGTASELDPPLLVPVRRAGGRDFFVRQHVSCLAARW